MFSIVIVNFHANNTKPFSNSFSDSSHSYYTNFFFPLAIFLQEFHLAPILSILYSLFSVAYVNLSTNHEYPIFKTKSAVSSVRTSEFVTINFFSFAVVKSILSTPLPKFAINLSLFPDLIIRGSVYSI